MKLDYEHRDEQRKLPHPVIHRGTVARIAIQCTCPDTGETGDFLYVSESPKHRGTRCSPVFSELTELYITIKNSGWKRIADAYVFEGRPIADCQEWE